MMRRIGTDDTARVGGPVMSKASSPNTQTSFARPCSGRRPDRVSSGDKTRANPPGIVRHRVPSNSKNIRNTTGRASSPCGPAHGATDGGTTGVATNRSGAAFTRSARLASSRGVKRAREIAGSLPFSAGWIRQLSGARNTASRSVWPRSAICDPFGSVSSSFSRRREIMGRKGARPGISTKPAPGALTIRTVPPRIASSRPGIPTSLVESSSSGSSDLPSCRRNSTST